MKIVQLNAVKKQVVDDALEYLERGWSVIPVHSVIGGRCSCKRVDCGKPGKHAPISWKAFQKRRATEVEVKDWWRKWPWSNVGIVTGEISGIFVLDVDGQVGSDSIRGLEMPMTVTAKTGGGGSHFYFRYPQDTIVGNKIGLLEKVDIRGNGGYVVAAPSIHESGKSYQWLEGMSPEEIELANPPLWLMDLLLSREPVKLYQEAAPVTKEDLLPCAKAFLETGVAQGSRDVCLFTLAKHCHKAKMAEEQAYEILEQVNSVCTPPLAERVIREKLKSAFHGKDGKGYTALGCDEPPWKVFCPGRSICQVFKPKGWPKSLCKKAFHGIAGEIVRSIDPYSEADDAAILINFLVAFGNIVGKEPHFMAGPDRHGVNLFAVLVGDTAKGRKGMSWGWIREIFIKIEESWALYKTPGGLSSGEGLIWEVRDPIEQQQPIKEKGKVTGYENVIVDPGVTDKRLLVVE
jgi:hypothetical protein